MWSNGQRESNPIASTRLPGNVVDVVARDFFLQAPDTIPAGLTTVRLRVTQGEHIAVIARLDSGHTAAEWLRARREGTPHPSWMHMIGGPGFPGKGRSANATIILTPGQYVLMCDVAARDGVHHFEKGMFRPLVVRAVKSDGSGAPMLPSADVVVKMRDYAFDLSRAIRAGTRILRVVNAGTVTHEFRLVHVLKGHTAKESLAWTPASKAPRPDEDVMALVGIGPGHELTTTLSLAQGEYVLLCVPQIDHGMIRVIRIASQLQRKAEL
jgi:plastocyanin